MGVRVGGRMTVLALALAAAGLAGAPAVADSRIERGQYLARIMDCTGCHTPGALTGAPDEERYLGGSSVGFMIPDLGVFYPPNLTSDVETGIGAWSVEEIMAAVRTGVRPDGRVLVPLMPWPSYGALTDADARALAAFLKSLPPISFDAPGPFGPDEQPTAPYLAVVVPE